MPARIENSDEQRETARRLWDDPEVSTATIAAYLGMHTRTLQRRAQEWGLPARPRQPPKSSSARGFDDLAAPGEPAQFPMDLASVAQTLARNVLTAIGRLDARRRDTQADPQEMARTFSLLAKTLAAAQALQAKDARERQEGRPAHDDDGEPPPRSLEELRDELARHLDRIVADEADAGGDDFVHIARACEAP